MKLFSVPNNLFPSQKGLALRDSKGFTLIELLVVIGILGILAASLVATIDPFEQLKKANDAKVQNATVEFQTANIRYYAAQNAFPWDNPTASAECLAIDGGSGDVPDAQTLDVDPGMADCLDDLITAGELKTGFTDVTGVLENVYVTETNDTLLACYKPTSKGGMRDKAAKYVPAPNANAPTSFTADTTNQCLSNGGAVECYWCTQ